MYMQLVQCPKHIIILREIHIKFTRISTHFLNRHTIKMQMRFEYKHSTPAPSVGSGMVVTP